MDSFSFTSQKVKGVLQSHAAQKRFFVGSALSDFQSHPHEYVKNGAGLPRSDWELFAHNQASPNQSEDHSSVPSFFTQSHSYVKRTAELGEGMFRLSLDFGRLCPQPGVFDTEQMKLYIRTLAALRMKGVEPMLTLYHWPHPLHLLSLSLGKNKIRKGAWEHKDFNEHFVFYVTEVTAALSNPTLITEALEGEGYTKTDITTLIATGLVRYFITINEPINTFLPTYLLGMYPPFKKFRFDLVPRVITKAVQAHRAAVEIVRRSALPTTRGPIQIGVAHNWIHFEGVAAWPAHTLINSLLTRRFEESECETDFIGINYYFRMKFPRLFPLRYVFSDNPYFGDIYPKGMELVLKKVTKEYPDKPIFITEFGFSDREDTKRPFWILETIRHIIEAMAQHVPVQGALLWSLADSYEWNLGMTQKFGLFTEKELSLPLEPKLQTLRSWEVWRQAIQTIGTPTDENLEALQRMYARAKEQFTKATRR